MLTKSPDVQSGGFATLFEGISVPSSNGWEMNRAMPSFLQKFRQLRRPTGSAVIVAAGHSHRMQGVDKILAPLGEKSVIVRTIAAFEACALVREVVVVTRADLTDEINRICRAEGFSKVTGVVMGGADRTHSVWNGIQALKKRPSLIAIHDGARPFVSQRLLERTVSAAARLHAVAPAVPVNDTIKQAKKQRVLSTPDRSELFAVQTPQVFDADLIRGALYYCMEKKISVTDDCSAVEQLGKQVALVEGERKNIKITTPQDLLIGEAFVSCSNAN